MKVSHSVLSNSLRPHGPQPASLLCPRNSPGKNTGIGCHSLLQGIFPTQGSNPHLLCLLHCEADSFVHQLMNAKCNIPIEWNITWPITRDEVPAHTKKQGKLENLMLRKRDRVHNILFHLMKSQNRGGKKRKLVVTKNQSKGRMWSNC